MRNSEARAYTHVLLVPVIWKAGRGTRRMAGKGKAVGKLVATVRMYIPAGMASPSPPLGPALGQVYI